MNKIVFFIVIALCGGFSTVASAQQSPFRNCDKVAKSALDVPALVCTVVENGTIIKDMDLNRGNCANIKKLILEAKTNYKWNDSQYNGIIEQYGYNKEFKFGENAILYTQLRGSSAPVCNVIEANISTNKGNWIFKW